MSKTKTYQTTPEYFHDQSEPLVFTDSSTLSSFLNNSNYKNIIATVMLRRGTGFYHDEILED